MTRSRYENQMPGHVATATQPGVAVPTKLRFVVKQGGNQLGDVQREANRIFREEKEGARPAPHVITIEDVTKGMALDDVSRLKIHKVIQETRADFGQHPQLRVPRLPHARMQLMSVLRSMDELDSTHRMEIARRAMVWWKRNVVTDMDASPKIRFNVSKSRDSLHKADKPPAGFQPVKGSKKGGYKKQIGGKWVYWYPGQPHPKAARKEQKEGGVGKEAFVQLLDKLDRTGAVGKDKMKKLRKLAAKDDVESLAKELKNMKSELGSMMRRQEEKRGAPPGGWGPDDDVARIKRSTPEQLKEAQEKRRKHREKIKNHDFKPGQSLSINGKTYEVVQADDKHDDGRASMHILKPTSGKSTAPRSLLVWPKDGRSELRRGVEMTMEGPVKSFEVITKKSLRKGGPYIGPKGGKWADPQHKIPWHGEGDAASGGKKHQGAKKLAGDSSFRKKMGKQIASAFRKKGAKVLRHIKEEFAEFKHAASAIKKLPPMSALTGDDKKAIKGAAQSIATTVAGTIAIGGLSHLTISALATHWAAETAIKSVGKAMIFKKSLRKADSAAMMQKFAEILVEDLAAKFEEFAGYSDEEAAELLSSLGVQMEKSLRKGDKDDSEDDEGKDAKPPEKKLQEKAEGKGSKKDGKDGESEKDDDDRPTVDQAEVEEIAEDEEGEKKGQVVKFHKDVEACVPADADYHYHVTEHSKHMAQYQALKEKDPERAEAHRHAANLHARIGNALHAAGETAKDHGRQEDPDFDEEMEDEEGMEAEGEEGDEEDDDEGEEEGGEEDGDSVGGGKDYKGRPLPRKPDAKRNPPGRDSRIESKRKRNEAVKKSFYIRKAHSVGVPLVLEW